VNDLSGTFSQALADIQARHVLAALVFAAGFLAALYGARSGAAVMSRHIAEARGRSA
jgi:hypothetical protein